MKKTKFCFIIILSFFVITLIIGTSYGYLNPKDTISGNSAYSEAIKIVQEVMKAYYIRGPYIQYNYAKTKYGIETPEDATSQKTKYDVCASFMYDVYTEAFGMHHDLDKFPRYNTEVLSEARNYYNNKAKRDGRFLVYYEKGSEKYVLGNSSKYSNFVKKIQPGDIFVYTGHVLVAYDVVKNPNTNQYDVLLLNSTQGPYIMTRITSTTTSRLSYNIFKSKYGNNNVLDIDREGTIQWKWLSTDENFVKDGTLTCKKEECAVIRPFYKTDENKVAFNYRFKESNYKKSKLRVEYPGLLIEKTVDANDNNSVYIGDKLTYTIKITNKSNVSYQEKNYQPFNIEETLGDYVKYVSSTKNGKIKNKTITWQIDKLLPNQSVDLKYTVEVINNVKNVSKVIQADGKFYSKNNTSVSISTGNVKNPIIPKVSKVNNSYQNCYDNNKNKYTGLNLINEIYKCVSTINYNFDKFKFEDIISKKNQEKNLRQQNRYVCAVISFKLLRKRLHLLPLPLCK